MNRYKKIRFFILSLLFILSNSLSTLVYANDAPAPSSTGSGPTPSNTGNGPTPCNTGNGPTPSTESSCTTTEEAEPQILFTSNSSNALAFWLYNNISH